MCFRCFSISVARDWLSFRDALPMPLRPRAVGVIMVMLVLPGLNRTLYGLLYPGLGRVTEYCGVGVTTDCDAGDVLIVEGGVVT